MVGLEHLDEDQVIFSNILNVMRHCLGDVSGVSRVVVESLCGVRGSVNSNPRRACNEVTPLIARGMPVDFAQCSWLNCYDCHGEHGCNWERRWVEDFDATSFRVECWLLLGKMIGV